MKTLVVLSDTHGNRAAIAEILGVLEEADFIVHLGDTSSDGNYVKSLFPEKCLVINGNCDFMRLGEDEKVFKVEGVSIFACHGHAYSVKSTRLKLLRRAEELSCSLALYGHTHVASEESENGVTLFNPGCLSGYSYLSYGYVVVNGDKAVCKTVYVNR